MPDEQTIPPDAQRKRISLEPGEGRIIGMVSGMAMLRMLGLFLLLPVLALWASGLEGATPMLVGLAVGGYGITQAVLQVPFGTLSDRIGRVPVIVLGLTVFALGSFVAAMSHHILGVIAGRLLQGAGAVSATLTALLADHTREEIRTRATAILGISIGSSFLIALVLGPLVASVTGVRGLFWLAGFMALTALALATVLPRTRPGARQERARRLTGRLTPGVAAIDASIFLLHMMLTASFVAAPFLLRDALGVPMETQWRTYFGALALSLVATVPLVLLGEKGRGSWIFVLSVGLLALGQGLLWQAADAWVLALAGLAIFFAGFNYLEARLPARLSVVAGPSGRGGALGLFYTSQFLGAFAGGVVGGWLMGVTDYSGVFVALGVVGVVWLLVTIGLVFGRNPAL
jgi:MFS family permease